MSSKSALTSDTHRIGAPTSLKVEMKGNNARSMAGESAPPDPAKSFMTFKKLRITGPGAVPYQLGQPMHVYDANVLLGTLDPVPVGNAGTEIHIEHFQPTRVDG